MHLKRSSAKWRPFCPGGDELSTISTYKSTSPLWAHNGEMGPRSDNPGAGAHMFIQCVFFATRGLKLAQNRTSSECCMPNFRPLLPRDLRMPGNPNFVTKFFGHQKAQTGPILAKSKNFWRWSGYISMPHFRPFLPCVLFTMLGNPNFSQFFWPPESQNWASTSHDKIISGGEQATSACHISGRSFHAFLTCSDTPISLIFCRVGWMLADHRDGLLSSSF